MSEWTDYAHDESDKENHVCSSSASSDHDDFKQQPAAKKTRVNKQSLSLNKVLRIALLSVLLMLI